MGRGITSLHFEVSTELVATTRPSIVGTPAFRIPDHLTAAWTLQKVGTLAGVKEVDVVRARGFHIEWISWVSRELAILCWPKGPQSNYQDEPVCSETYR